MRTDRRRHPHAATRARPLLRSLAALALGLAVVGAVACTEDEDPFYIAPPDDCGVDAQKQWILDTMDYAYLWRAESPSVDLAAYETPEDLLRALRIDIDRWSYVADKVTTDKLFRDGQYIGLGFRNDRDPEGNVRVSFVHTDSPADRVGIQRGDILYSVNGVTIAELDANGWGDIWGPDDEGVPVSLEFQAASTAASDIGQPVGLRAVDMVKEWVTITTVSVHRVIDLGERKVGYLEFETFVEPAVAALDEAFRDFQAAGVDAVIVDMRYNGGGRISVAEHLINLLIGRRATGQVAFGYRYNDNLAGEASTTNVSEVARTLDLSEVVFIVDRRTLSASELVINSVAPYIPVTLVGGQTGGKPVGSRGFEFCEEKLLIPITFKLVNRDEQGEYYDGFAPDCAAVDDLTVPLGDDTEDMLAAAVGLLRGDGCAAAGARALERAPAGLAVRSASGGLDPWRDPAQLGVRDALREIHGSR